MSKEVKQFKVRSSNHYFMKQAEIFTILFLKNISQFFNEIYLK